MSECAPRPFKRPVAGDDTGGVLLLPCVCVQSAAENAGLCRSWGRFVACVSMPRMRIAALYDIHGNLPALDAVLTEVELLDVDAIVVGGDVVPGPMMAETVD